MCDFDSYEANLAIERDKEYKLRLNRRYTTLAEWAREHNARVDNMERNKAWLEQAERETKGKKMERKYVKGLYLKKKESKYGTFIKGSIKMPDFNENKPNSKGYINFCIFETKEGKPYAVLDDYEENKTSDKVIEFEIAEDELPF